MASGSKPSGGEGTLSSPDTPKGASGGERRGPGRSDAGGGRFYATRLRQLLHLELDEFEAAAVWRDAVRHRRTLIRQLDRDVGLRVALLDFIENIHPQVGRRRIQEPQIIGREALEAMERRAVEDPLSGLHNRQFFEDQLRHEVERCRRYGATAALVMLDLDDFKAINDQLGHREGDLAIAETGAVIRRHVRAADVPCRYGGDEFAIIMPDTRVHQAVPMVERIRADAVRVLRPVLRRAGHTRAGMSAGIAAIPVHAYAGEDLVRCADEALYRAKAAGGDRVVIADLPADDRERPLLDA